MTLLYKWILKVAILTLAERSKGYLCLIIQYFNRLIMSLPKFSSGPQSFHAELKKRISTYFEEVGKAKTGNYNLFLKAVILMVSFAFIYVHLVFFTPNAFWAIVESVLLGGLLPPAALCPSACQLTVLAEGVPGSPSGG